MRSLCYNSLFQQLTYDRKELRGRVLNRVLALLERQFSCSPWLPAAGTTAPLR